MKRKIAHLFKTGILLFGISLILYNCQEENSLETQNNLINEIQNKVNTDNIKLLYTKNNLIVDYNTYQNIIKDDIEFYEFKTNFIAPLKNNSEIFNTPSYYILAYKVNNNITIKYLEIRAYDYSLDKLPLNFINLGSFSGSFRYFNEKGELENTEAYIEGYLVKTDKKEYLPLKRTILKKAEKDEILQLRVQPCTQVPSILYIHETTHNYMDYYKASYRVDSNGNTIPGSLTVASTPYKSIYLGSTTQTYTYTSFSCDTPHTGDEIYKSEYMRQQQLTDCGPGYDNVSYKGGCVDTEENIIINLNHEAKCIYDKLKGLKLFKTTIKKFENSNDYNLIIEQNNNCQPADDGCTDGSDIQNIKINIQITPSGQPLNYAATLLHEGIHAELFKYVDEHKKGLDPNNRSNLLGWYFQYKGIQLQSTHAQHQHMADNYVKPIAEAIRKLDNFSYPLEYYMGYGWDGLRRYGYDGYYDNGVWKSLDKSIASDYYLKQKKVNANTKLNGNECK